MKILYFATPADFRAWLEAHHASADELWVGFYKKGSGRPSLTWPESVDEALCFGWIDGLRKSVDAERYRIRFTPRRKGSIWSAVNLERARALIEEGRMRPAGLAAWEARRADRTNRYSFEQGAPPGLTEQHAARLRRNRAAWKFWNGQPPGYRKTASWWVESAKREETRLRRLEQLVECSAAGRRIPPLERAKK